MTDQTTQHPRILSLTVKVICDACDIEDDFDFDADDLSACVEYVTPCACDRQIGVSADAFAQYLSTPIEPVTA